MSRVTCVNCGAEDDARSMTVCPTCRGYLCPRCADPATGQCGRCSQSNLTNCEPV